MATPYAWQASTDNHTDFLQMWLNCYLDLLLAMQNEDQELPMTCLSLFMRMIVLTGVVAATLVAVQAQAPQPDGGGVRPGILPATWKVSGPQCPPKPEFQVHEYNSDLYILRESGCSNYEKPFLYLLFGKDKVLML